MPETKHIALYAFYRDPAQLQHSRGVDGYVIDWESKNKSQRQVGYDTEINLHRAEDLRTLRDHTDLPIICRINGPGLYSKQEVEEAIEAGATDLLLPMVREVKEVKALLDLVGDRCQIAIMVETQQAVLQAALLAALPLSKVYVGLNDLCIDRKAKNLFEPMLDGTISQLRDTFHQPLGYAGLTHAAGGAPIPCRLLLGHMIDHGCDFTFLRRSYYRDLEQYSSEEIIQSIADYRASYKQVSPSVKAEMYAALEQRIKAFNPNPLSQEPT